MKKRARVDLLKPKLNGIGSMRYGALQTAVKPIFTCSVLYMILFSTHLPFTPISTAHTNTIPFTQTKSYNFLEFGSLESKSKPLLGYSGFNMHSKFYKIPAFLTQFVQYFFRLASLACIHFCMLCFSTCFCTVFLFDLCQCKHRSLLPFNMHIHNTFYINILSRKIADE